MEKYPVYMPKYGMTMTEGYLVEWLFKEGDYIDEGKPLFTVETEKSNTDVEASSSGYLTGIRFNEGENVPVGEIMAYLVDSLEEAEGPGSHTVEAQPVEIAEKENKEKTVSELLPETSAEGEPLEGIRKKIAQSMMKSITRTAQYTLMRDVVVDPLVSLKNRLLDISYNDLLIKGLGLAIYRHPEVQQQLIDGKVYKQQEINIGIAVSIDNGLSVPVIKKVNQLNLQQIAEQRKKLVEKARENNLDAGETTNGICTLSNLGNFDIDSFTPVLNPPETIILGVGRIAQRPTVEDGVIVVRHVLNLSLTADHQLLDGANAAVFLQTFCSILQTPEVLNV